MAEATLHDRTVAHRTRGFAAARVVQIAWRNLWRNPRRTWLTAGGIAFSIWLLVFARSMQQGALDMMVDNGARMFTGHLQVQHPAYFDDPRVEYLVPRASELRAALAAHPSVEAAATRAQAFGLVSVGERSYGAQIMGVQPEREAPWSSLASMGLTGRYLERPGEVFMGARLARNLGATIGTEVVMLGTGADGSVAAAAGTLVGTFETGQPELDRSLAQIHLDDFRSGWSLAPDDAHAVVVIARRVATTGDIAAHFAGRLSADAAGHVRVLTWQALMPEAVQSMDIKMVATQLFYGLVAIIVTFSVVNAFVMTVFERTPEFGMLIAIGMRRGLIGLVLQIEALCLCIVGIVLGVGASLAVLALLGAVGLPLPDAAASVAGQFNLPARVYPSFQARSALFAAVVMLVGTQLAALLPGLRIRRLNPVAALHARE